MKLLLCNEVIREFNFEAQCQLAAELGYDGLEVAPFTLGEVPHQLPAARRAELRRAAADAGITIGGLHWLLVTPEGLSITDPDEGVRYCTLEVIRRLVDLCADLGGQVMVHGSPAQRQLPDDRREDAWMRGRDAFAEAAEAAEAAGIIYCIEPLARQETNFINNVAEAVELVETINNRALRTMVDCRAARLSEDEDLPALLEHWLPSGLIAHVHLNDRNRRAPGQGQDRFAAVMQTLRRLDYQGAAGVEPFVYQPNGPTTAACAASYLRGLEEALTEQHD